MRRILTTFSNEYHTHRTRHDTYRASDSCGAQCAASNSQHSIQHGFGHTIYEFYIYLARLSSIKKNFFNSFLAIYTCRYNSTKRRSHIFLTRARNAKHAGSVSPAMLVFSTKQRSLQPVVRCIFPFHILIPVRVTSNPPPLCECLYYIFCNLLSFLFGGASSGSRATWSDTCPSPHRSLPSFMRARNHLVWVCNILWPSFKSDFRVKLKCHTAMADGVFSL